MARKKPTTDTTSGTPLQQGEADILAEVGATQVDNDGEGELQADEEKVRSQLDKVLSAENEIKKTQLGLMVRIKNLLTGQQQGQLHQIRKQMMPFGGPGPARGPAPGDEERTRMMMERQRALEQARGQRAPGGPGEAPSPAPGQ